MSVVGISRSLQQQKQVQAFEENLSQHGVMFWMSLGDVLYSTKVAQQRRCPYVLRLEQRRRG